MRRIAALSFAAFVALAVFACSDDHEHAHASDEFPACKEISAACHDLDTGSGFAHDCHELAHDAKDEATCTAKKAECVAGCKPLDGGGGSDSGGSSDAATGG